MMTSLPFAKPRLTRFPPDTLRLISNSELSLESLACQSHKTGKAKITSRVILAL
jgi:hypothetical protein